jgi:hypothetical protein
MAKTVKAKAWLNDALRFQALNELPEDRLEAIARIGVALLIDDDLRTDALSFVELLMKWSGSSHMNCLSRFALAKDQAFPVPRRPGDSDDVANPHAGVVSERQGTAQFC